jgi:tetratricopeptide (TPR) repeat protein
MSKWWDPLLQTTVDAFYAGDLKSGLRACEQLLSHEDLPWQIELQVRRNLVFYTPTLQQLTPWVTRQRITIPVPEGWSIFNPSIAVDPMAPEGGFALTIRSANYTVTRFLEYDVTDADDIFRTTNYLATLSPDLQLQTVQRIDDAAFRPEPPPFPVSGYEDARLVYHCGSRWCSATVRDHTPRGTCQIALLRLQDAKVAEEHLLSDGRSRDEKNWMPVATGEPQLRFVYSLAPTRLLRYDDARAMIVPDVVHPGPAIARTFSGGSQVIGVDGGYLCLIHDRVNFDDGSRIYHHRWVWFDADWRLSRLSPPFAIQESGIEFAAGLAQSGETLIFSYGVRDREAWLATVPLAEVLALLEPPIGQAVVAIDEPSGPAHLGPLGANAPFPPALTPPSLVPANPGITPFPSTSPVIVSTTLAGSNQDIIGDAIRSVVDWVDRVLVIDTGIGDDSLEIARSIAGDKLLVRQFPWRNDFAAARNFALAAAAEAGADWAVTLDTDERIDIGDVDIHAVLAATKATSLHVKHVNATYGKERFFRLPAQGQYIGPTHEAFIREGGESETLAGVLFDELGKTHEQYRQKAERDIAILTRHTQEHPDDPRWFYYLGDSYSGLGRNEEAIAAFRTCASLNGWDEEGGWAMYRAAECLLKLNRPVEAVEACAAGMAKHAGQAELPWLAAFASWQAERPAQAIYWARQAIAMGYFAGHGASVPRIGFRHPPALWEGPYDVLRFALRAIGDEAGADEAERLFHEAKTARDEALANDRETG